MRFIDTHAHLNLEAFTADRDAVAARCHTEGVGVINIGTGEATSTAAVELANAHTDMRAIIGLHPIHAVTNDTEGWVGETFNAAVYRALAQDGHVVGIGECGLDYFHTSPDSYGIQEAAFIAQIKLANELGLPLMIHTRGPKPGEQSPTGRSVYRDVYDLLRQYATVPGNVHFFAGTYEEAKLFLELGFTISFTGVITFARSYDEAIKNVPLQSLHGETDCPYVAPVPYRGQRCEPWMVTEVYAAIAAIRTEDPERVREQLLENARTLWKFA